MSTQQQQLRNSLRITRALRNYRCFIKTKGQKPVQIGPLCYFVNLQLMREHPDWMRNVSLIKVFKPM